MNEALTAWLGFAVVKLAGYFLAGRVVVQAYTIFYRTLGEPPTRALPPAWRPAVARTALGVVSGLAYSLAWSALAGEPDPILFFAGLAPLRFVETAVVLWFWFERGARRRGPVATLATLGAIWSYVLDLPAVLMGWAVPGGYWVS